MNQPLSRYRRAARQMITQVLAALPPDATLADARRALTAANPWKGTSGDGHCWQRQCWSRERVAALKQRFPEKQVEPKPGLGFVLARRSTEDTLLWLSVKCDWCRGRIAGGCLVCLDLHQRLRRAVADPGFRALARDVEARGILADYLSDVHGIEVPP